MRGKFSIILMVGLVVSLCSLTTLAQVEEQKAKLFSVDDYAVKPSMVDEFFTLMKEMIPICAKHKFPYHWYTYGTPDYHCLIVWPVENYADIDKMYKAFDELWEKAGKEQLQDLTNRFATTYEYFHSSMFYMIPELCYTPESPRLKPGEGNFISFDICYVQPGKGKELEEINKEWVVLSREKNVPTGFNLFEGDIGTDMPVVVFSEKGKDAADFFSQNAKNLELWGEKGRELWKKTEAICRKIETKTAWFLPDLSYIPEEK